MIDWNWLVKMKKESGIDLRFYDDVKLKKCSCGATARMYSEVRTEKIKKISFEHIFIKCEQCKKNIHGFYDISGIPNDFYRPKEEVIERIVQKWNRENSTVAELMTNYERNGIFSDNKIYEKNDWDMPGNQKK